MNSRLFELGSLEVLVKPKKVWNTLDSDLFMNLKWCIYDVILPLSDLMQTCEGEFTYTNVAAVNILLYVFC